MQLSDAPVRGVLQPSASDRAVRFLHQRYLPSADLSAYVEHYWSVSWDLAGRPPQYVEILPHPSMHMVFEHSGETNIVGVCRGKFTRVLRETNGVFGVKFKPGGFFPFLAAPVSSLTNRTASLDSVFGACGQSLAASLGAETNDSGRRGVVEGFLRSRDIGPDVLVPWIADVVYSVMSDRTILKVEDLAARYRVNKRTLQRQFAKYVGVTPKWVIQRYRLHEAAAQLAAAERVNHAKLAAMLGYNDQAHFIRDFRAMVGTPPAAYAARRANVDGLTR